MIQTRTYRGDLRDDDGTVVNTCDLTPDEWVGEIVSIPHPNSGHMGKSLGKVVEATPVQRTRKKPRHGIENTGDEPPEYEEVEYTKLVIVDLLMGTAHRMIKEEPIPPGPSFVKTGTEYAVYALQHRNGRGEWVEIAHRPSANPWSHNQFGVKSTQENYTGHEETRIVKESVTHHRDENADPADTDAYTLEYDLEPITVDSPEDTPQ